MTTARGEGLKARGGLAFPLLWRRGLRGGGKKPGVVLPLFDLPLRRGRHDEPTPTPP